VAWTPPTPTLTCIYGPPLCVHRGKGDAQAVLLLGRGHHLVGGRAVTGVTW
jgi:hypothetical protein